MKHRLGLLVALGCGGHRGGRRAGVEQACRSCHTEYRLPAH